MTDLEDVFESSLFDNESYELQTITFGSQSIMILCSQSATTDHDLTGQILWPAASLLAKYLAANAAVLQGCNCACELGAGLGLVGLLAAQSCPVILTDHNDVVLRVLARNAALNQAKHSISLKALPALFSVASQLLSKKTTSQFLLGYVSRAYSIDKQLLIEAKNAGLVMKEVAGTRRDVGGSLHGLIYSIKHAV